MRKFFYRLGRWLIEMKKKLTVLMGCILTLVMVFALSGCGGSDSSDKKTLTIGC